MGYSEMKLAGGDIDISVDQIRLDLKEVRYYYRRRDALDEAFEMIGRNVVVEKVNKYNSIMSSAPIRMYDLYFYLYVKDFTQEGLGYEWNFDLVHIHRMNRDLLEFLQKELNK